MTEEEKTFKDANNSNLDYVALLAKQVVAGTNYMFLCNDDTSYKIVVVYNNLDGVSQITSINDFDPTKYVNKNYELDNEELSGGWYVEIPKEKNTIPVEIQNYFDKATETLTGAAYYPIAVVATQNKSYAVLCYGEGSYTGSNTGIFMITLDAKNNPKIVSISAIDLSEYNN